MFDKVVQNINDDIERRKKEDIENKESSVFFSIADTPSLNESFVKDRIKNIDNISDRELYDILRSSYSTVLEDIFIKDDTTYLDMFVNTRFLSVFIQVINSVVLSQREIVYCNKISYDYLTICNNNHDEYTKSLFLTLSKTVNKSIIPLLLGLGLDEDFSSYLALSRYSSLEEFVNIRRVNYLLISSNPNILTEQMIIYIYEKLFTRFTSLFKATMFDVYTDEDLENIGPGASEIYSNISLAIIDILNVMTSSDIRKVLISYAGDYHVVPDTEIRFSINSLAISDYSRILNVVKFLEVNENIIVP